MPQQFYEALCVKPGNELYSGEMLIRKRPVGLPEVGGGRESCVMKMKVLTLLILTTRWLQSAALEFAERSPRLPFFIEPVCASLPSVYQINMMTL